MLLSAVCRVDTEPAVSEYEWKEGEAGLRKKGDAGTA